MSRYVFIVLIYIYILLDDVFIKNNFVFFIKKFKNTRMGRRERPTCLKQTDAD